MLKKILYAKPRQRNRKEYQFRLIRLFDQKKNTRNVRVAIFFLFWDCFNHEPRRVIIHVYLLLALRLVIISCYLVAHFDALNKHVSLVLARRVARPQSVLPRYIWTFSINTKTLQKKWIELLWVVPYTIIFIGTTFHSTDRRRKKKISHRIVLTFINTVLMLI